MCLLYKSLRGGRSNTCTCNRSANFLGQQIAKYLCMSRFDRRNVMAVLFIKTL